MRYPRTLAIITAATCSLASCRDDVSVASTQDDLRAKEPQLRAAVARLRQLALASDHDGMWELMDRTSQAKMAEQLNNLRNSPSPEAAERLLAPLGMKTSDLAGISAKEYFVAMSKGMAKALPEVLKTQLEQARTRRVKKIDWFDGGAFVREEAADGHVLSTQWVWDAGSWRAVADVADSKPRRVIRQPAERR